MSTTLSDDCTTFAISNPASSNPASSIGKVFVRFTGCEAVDEILLVEVVPDTFQWLFAGTPALPASDLFTSAKAAWEFAWRCWSRQIQVAENFPFPA